MFSKLGANYRMKTIILTIKTRQTWSLSLIYRVCGSHSYTEGKLLVSGVCKEGFT